MNDTLRILSKYLLLVLIVTLQACSSTDCVECPSESEALDPERDMLAFLSLGKKTLYVMPGDEELVLQTLAAKPTTGDRYQTTLVAANGESAKVEFAVVLTSSPYFFVNMDGTLMANAKEAFDAVKKFLRDAVATAEDAAVGAAAEAADDAIEQAEEAVNAAIDAAQDAVEGSGSSNSDQDDSLSWTRDLILFDEVKGVIVWKNAQCGTPRPRKVSKCRGPIPADGEELAGMYWRTTEYSKAKCVRGTTICTEIRQVGSYIEIAEDNQCSIVKIIRPVETLYYCQ